MVTVGTHLLKNKQLNKNMYLRIFMLVIITVLKKIMCNISMIHMLLKSRSIAPTDATEELSASPNYYDTDFSGS